MVLWVPLQQSAATSLQFVCLELCDTSSAVVNAGKTKGVTDGNCCPHSDDVKVATVCIRVDFSEQLTLGTENVLNGIGEATVFLWQWQGWCWTVVFDKFIAAGDEVAMEEANDNCWTEMAGCAVVLADTKAR